jgi:hypothetical protein
MRKELAADTGFPGIAFATLPKTGETIAIRYGERIYYRVDSPKTADELNAIYGVTQAQANALLASVISTWEMPQAGRDSHGPQRRTT